MTVVCMYVANIEIIIVVDNGVVARRNVVTYCNIVFDVTRMSNIMSD